ncbi:VOC family protein [Actinokineospora sp. NBRC 105648]|uniref:VOC family protein n=1 Tax=Actinokineospora sp. NBRC 105648 TaxID=3032206 RepID=UPI0024A0BB95|nr:VOC family protein [Actinokineospora sp. NBRC 105648]GLZ36738.1 glyoxalase [Actinokineospora sp. NBRC 105648]
MGIALTHTTVWVLDQDSAKAFYTETLGLELRSDVEIGKVVEGGAEGIRWLTVGPAGVPGAELILAHPAMGHDPETAEQIRALVAKGALGPGVMTTEDCHKSYRELSERGVVFLSEPADRPYGIEAMFRDDSGNWFSLTQHKDFYPAG